MFWKFSSEKEPADQTLQRSVGRGRRSTNVSQEVESGSRLLPELNSWRSSGRAAPAARGSSARPAAAQRSTGAEKTTPEYFSRRSSWNRFPRSRFRTEETKHGGNEGSFWSVVIVPIATANDEFTKNGERWRRRGLASMGEQEVGILLLLLSPLLLFERRITISQTWINVKNRIFRPPGVNTVRRQRRNK